MCGYEGWQTSIGRVDQGLETQGAHVTVQVGKQLTGIPLARAVVFFSLSSVGNVEANVFYSRPIDFRYLRAPSWKHPEQCLTKYLETAIKPN